MECKNKEIEGNYKHSQEKKSCRSKYRLQVTGFRLPVTCNRQPVTGIL